VGTPFRNSNANAHPPESDVRGLTAKHARSSFPPAIYIMQIDKIQPLRDVSNARLN
jgi:hypothetical protein